MADGHGHSRYVKLTKDQGPVDDITPGELNQPIKFLRCVECGQVLPESYEPPADEDWATGIFGCFEDAESWLFSHLLLSGDIDIIVFVVARNTGFFCPCVLFGRNIETFRDDIPWTNACVCHAMCIEGGMALAAATALFHGIDPWTLLGSVC
ncbi:hypothetical protein LWI29_029049 [Acer saccharum]|uniref:Uncharacterized protein n=1 Tax=Acer saccharum TaxID=4024 RepID=A0AA39S1C7_ACESA|nr:hypothetical protein LWI29_029049 [Acer saccharum]KAK1560278.1 hypothetical protein Q3G72_024505 [Acer saccharum]